MVTDSYDSAGRISQVQGGGTTYASGIQYAAHGAISQVTLGNTLTETTSYNNRLQPTQMQVGESADAELLLLPCGGRELHEQ